MSSAEKLTESEIGVLRALFDEKANGNATITLKQFGEILQTVGRGELDKENLQTVAAGVNASDELNKKQFLEVFDPEFSIQVVTWTVDFWRDTWFVLKLFLQNKIESAKLAEEIEHEKNRSNYQLLEKLEQKKEQLKKKREEEAKEDPKEE